MSRNVQLAVVAAVALVFGGGGFVAGMTLAPAASPAAVNPEIAAALAQRRAGGAVPGGAVAAPLGGQVIGKVISTADGSITVEVTRPGADSAQSVIALVGGSTKIVRTAETEISLADIKEGDQVIVVGPRDATTGTVSASTVVVGLSSLRPGR